MSICFIQSIWLENYLICVTVYDAYLKIHIPFGVCTQKVLSLSAPLHSRTTSPVDFRRTYCFVMLAVYSIFFEWTSHIVDNVCSRSATYHVAYTFFSLLFFFLLRLMHMSIYFLSVYSEQYIQASEYQNPHPKKNTRICFEFFFYLFRISFHLNFVPSCSSRLNKMRNEIRVNMRTSIEHTHSSQCSGVGVEPVSITHGYCQKSPFFNIFKAKNNKERLLFESKLIADHIANVQSCGNCL